MEAEDEELPLCYICGLSATPEISLTKATAKGYRTQLMKAQQVGNKTIIDHLKRAWECGAVHYHSDCAKDLSNKAVKSEDTTKRE